MRDYCIGSLRKNEITAKTLDSQKFGGKWSTSWLCINFRKLQITARSCNTSKFCAFGAPTLDGLMLFERDDSGAARGDFGVVCDNEDCGSVFVQSLQ